MSENICVLRGLIEAPHPPELNPVSTRVYALVDGEPWVDVGASPLMLMSRNMVAFVVSDDPPDSLDDGFRLESRVPYTVALNSHVWAKAVDGGDATLIVAGPVHD